jgi:gluconolactonase
MIRFLPLVALSIASAFADDYALGPDSQPQPGVPHGTLTKHSWTSKIFPGTIRDYWIYAPAQYQVNAPACLMVFQDGTGLVSESGAWHVPIVFDNLIHKHEMPVTIGIFIDPGVLPAKSPDNQQNRYNRSYEYDGLGDRYARFLLEEIIPEAARQYTLSSDPNDRAIAGSSSGGIASFTVAWNRPDAFRRVLSFIGSYTDLRGGYLYPSLIRKTEPKPLRIFLQDGAKDLNIYAGSWYLANQELASALEFAGYDFRFVTGTEAHNSKHGSAILPDALRWLWRDYPQPIARSKSEGDRQFVSNILDPASGWEIVSQGHKFTEGAAVDRDGNVFFADIPNERVHRIGLDNKVTVFRENSGGANGLMFGPDGRLYAAQDGKKRIVAWSMDGKESVLTEDVNSNDLAVDEHGNLYFTDPRASRVWYLPAGGERRIVEQSIGFPNGVRFSPDHSLLLVADTVTRWVWSFQVQPDGSLANGEPFYRLDMPEYVKSGPLRAGADGMTVDSEGYLYVATGLGIQICDQPGRVVAIIPKPEAADPSNVVFGGPRLEYLYVTAGDKVFRRHLRRHGVFPWTVTKPPVPRL